MAVMSPSKRKRGERGPGKRPNAILVVKPKRKRTAAPTIPDAVSHRSRYRIGLTKAKVKAALIEAKGNLAAAATALGCVRNTVENWTKKHPDLAQVLHDQREACVDIAENSIIRQVEKDNTQATIFVLKCLGKKRGWVDNPNIQIHAHAEVGSGTWLDIMKRAMEKGDLNPDGTVVIDVTPEERKLAKAIAAPAPATNEEEDSCGTPEEEF